ncbi:MAG: GNAT family N-acetyltransferase [Pseudomonadales bacterium]
MAALEKADAQAGTPPRAGVDPQETFDAVDFTRSRNECSDLNLTLCNFHGDKDLPRVKAFLLGREQWQSLPDYWTAGKSTVGTFQTIFDSPAIHHKFWRDEEGKYHAYLWLHPEPSETIEGNGNCWRMFMHPRVRTKELANTVIASAEEQLSRLVDQSSADKSIETVAYGEDTWLALLLKEHGYTKQEALDVYMRCSLDEEIDEPELVDGYTIRPLDAQNDIVQRSGVQSDAFAGESEPGEWSIANTERFLVWYEGRDDLDLVAVTAEGEIGSFAVFLVDPGTLVGELDPVGTRAAHQRKGLAKAVLLSGLHYLKSKGMKRVAVRTGVANAPAIRTYESVGFEVVDHLYRYRKVAG